ncbi:PREDICTED: tigger transposable element-derived protein 1-like [Habropoda laboriosa]|uniref:tigger transposable element-derived protein 1-like n=1 Tax=Habropoda laboriosa TaxID=597456 RepID=UPI00083E3C84|nr:PREDICTED: tigger transposable element-derived protein 1-like [Habropoda laboriosa]
MPKEIKKKTQMKRRVISLESKIKILGRLRNGERVTDVAKFYSMNEATIRTIRKNEDSIRRSVAAGSSASMSTASYVRDVAMENMEKALMIWLEDATQKQIPIDTSTITNKALKIYEKIKNQLPSTSSAEKKLSFSVSHGWFERFKRRHSLHNLRLKGEQASADSDAAQQYPVFNADESGLFWKKMPERTYLAKAHKSASGHKAAKSRITVLFCCNASGDHIMKPLVINKSKTPRSFKGININNLPVYWMANKKAWVTATLFNEWFHNFFVPDVKRYLSKKGLPFKALLLIDNAPGNPQDLQHENVQVVFLPKNTTSLLQPLDQGIISTFKALYIKRTFRYILEQIENDESLPIMDAWKKFTILDCVKHVGVSYTEIKQSTLNACWKKLWPDVVEGENSRLPLEHEYSQITEMAHTMGGKGFEDFAEADIVELMADKELDEDDLVDMVNETNDRAVILMKRSLNQLRSQKKSSVKDLN